jgi:isoleucyl-tRNA synthetase
MVREVVHDVQSQRKTLDLEFTDRIELAFETASPELRAALDRHLDYVAAETLATRASFGRLAGGTADQLDIDGHPLTIAIRRVGGGS